MSRIRFIFSIAALLVLVACGAPVTAGVPSGPSQSTAAPPTPAATVSAGANSGAATAGVPSAATSVAPASPTPVTSAAPSAGSAGTIVLTLQPDSQASYKVREQLARVNLPSDAVGTTKAVTGELVIQPDGKIVSDRSKFAIDMTKLTSDSAMRDNYIRSNTLQTSTYPQATFVPTAVTGLPSPLPTSGDVSFKLTGNLTVRGITKPVTWDAQAKIAGSDLTGTATTVVKFGDFGMSPPTTMMVLSVVDSIALQIDFHMKASTP